MLKVERPAAGVNKINHKEDFEFCYLRHQYFRRAKFNPTEEEMKPFMKIVENLTKNTFFTYYNLFKSVGMYHDDVLNIGRVHLVSFLGLYHLDQTKEKKEEFAENTLRYKYREAKESDFDQKNKANFTCFFKQRMEDLVRVCRQKVRNIKGQSQEEYFVFCGKAHPPKSPTRLLREHEDFGYKKIDFAVFKSIRKKAQVSNSSTIFEFDGTWYVAIAIEQKNLDLNDIVGSGSNPYENDHNKRPDELFENLNIKSSNWSKEIKGLEGDDCSYLLCTEERDSENYSRLFSRKSNYRKKILLQKFLAKNRYKVQYKEEVATAKRLLRSLGE